MRSLTAKCRAPLFSLSIPRQFFPLFFFFFLFVPLRTCGRWFFSRAFKSNMSGHYLSIKFRTPPQPNPGFRDHVRCFTEAGASRVLFPFSPPVKYGLSFFSPLRIYRGYRPLSNVMETKDPYIKLKTKKIRKCMQL